MQNKNNLSRGLLCIIVEFRNRHMKIGTSPRARAIRVEHNSHESPLTIQRDRRENWKFTNSDYRRDWGWNIIKMSTHRNVHISGHVKERQRVERGSHRLITWISRSRISLIHTHCAAVSSLVPIYLMFWLVYIHQREWSACTTCKITLFFLTKLLHQSNFFFSLSSSRSFQLNLVYFISWSSTQTHQSVESVSNAPPSAAHLYMWCMSDSAVCAALCNCSNHFKAKRFFSFEISSSAMTIKTSDMRHMRWGSELLCWDVWLPLWSSSHAACFERDVSCDTENVSNIKPSVSFQLVRRSSQVEKSSRFTLKCTFPTL